MVGERENLFIKGLESSDARGYRETLNPLNNYRVIFHMIALVDLFINNL